MKHLLFANTDWYLYNFRLALARELRTRGDEVVLVSPPGIYGPRLREMGYRWLPFDFSRKGLNPLAELRTLARLVRLYQTEKPDLVHHFTIKCVAYGGLAARLAGISARVAAITGLGHVFTTDSVKTRALRPVVRQLYRQALSGSEVIFQNPEDQAFFELAGLVPAATHCISGSGVDTQRFRPADQSGTGLVTFIMVGRLLKEKGIREFVDAAKIVRQAVSGTRFMIVGDYDAGNPSSLTESDLQAIGAAGTVDLLGHREDVAELLRNSDIAVLPSYREGTPRSLLEAASCGLPLIATDVPGCRQIVRHGQNGLLVPPRDAAALAQAMVRLAQDAATRRQYGLRSRAIACEEFSEDLVVARTLEVYRLAHARHD